MVNTVTAGKLLGVTDDTIRNYVNSGLVEAQRIGLRGIIRLDTDKLRALAVEVNRDFDEGYFAELQAQQASQ